MTVSDQPFRKLISAAAASLLLIGIGGCAAKRQEVVLDVAPTTGALALDVENFNGTVEVRAGGAAAKTDRARVVAVADVDALIEEDRREAILGGVSIEADLTEEGARGVLRVRTSSNHTGMDDHRVDLTIYMPSCDGVRINNRGGTVLVVGASGATEITNRLGPIEVRTDQPMVDPVTLTTVDGNIYYQVPVSSAGQFDLETLDGRAAYRDRVGSTDQNYGTNTVAQARLNSGTNPVVARTNRGDINVWVVDDPVGLTRIIKKSFPHPQDVFFTKGSRRHTRNLPEDHPEVTGPRKVKFYD